MNPIQSQSLALLCGALALNAGTLGILFEPRWNDRALQIGELTLTNQVGQLLSVTRLDMLLSNFAFRQTNGIWLYRTGQHAFVSAAQGRVRFDVTELAEGTFDRIRFHVGLAPHINHSDPAQWPAGHPLNPTVNGLHWSWQGGYVFLALEGNWRDRIGNLNGFSFHHATDQNLTTIELPVQFRLESNHIIAVAMHVDKLFPQPLTHAASSTHSREDDPVAAELHARLTAAFAVTSERPVSSGDSNGCDVPRHTRPTPNANAVLPPNTRPYRLAVSSFFPRPALPLDNPLTEQGVQLGRRLFHEPLLSVNNQQSCASCHDARAAFTDPGRPFSIGAEGHAGHRNSMPLFNLAWKSSFFWDGRAPSLREQVLLPIQDKLEMHETLTNVVEKLAATPDYPVLFHAAFGSRAVDSDRIARALEQFLLTQVSHDSKFDGYMRGQSEFSPEEQRGFELFYTEYDPRRDQLGADCFHCHGGPLFQSQAFANNGLDTHLRDPGRQLVTGKPSDAGKFAVPSLRNIELTAPYMHDGRFATLEDVIEHYSMGVKRTATLDPNLAKHPSGGVPLSNNDKRALVAFLRTLTDIP